MTNPWTPGPWRYRPNEHDDWGRVVSPDNWTIAYARWSPKISDDDLNVYRNTGVDPAKGNATLISAAPEMAEVLEYLTAYLERYGRQDDEGVVRARALLARIRGDAT
jgi:hypothetical protein